MPEAEVEFVDGNSVHYEDVTPDHDNRILLVYKNGTPIGFSPYEAILALRWVEQKKPSGASFYEEQLLRKRSEEEKPK